MRGESYVGHLPWILYTLVVVFRHNDHQILKRTRAYEWFRVSIPLASYFLLQWLWFVFVNLAENYPVACFTLSKELSKVYSVLSCLVFVGKQFRKLDFHVTLIRLWIEKVIYLVFFYNKGMIRKNPLMHSSSLIIPGVQAYFEV